MASYDTPSQSTLDILQAALSLAVKRALEGAEAVTDAEIEKAPELFGSILRR